jgi:hypothetical protein
MEPFRSTLILEPNKKLERFHSDYQTRNGTIPFEESEMERFRPTRFSNQTYPNTAEYPSWALATRNL